MYDIDYTDPVPIGALTLLVEQNDVVFGVDLTNIGSSPCQCAEGGGGSVLNGINAWFARRTRQEIGTGLWNVRKIGFDGKPGAEIAEVNLLDAPPDEMQAGSLGNVDLSVADGLRVYFGKRGPQNETTGLWTVNVLTSGGSQGKAVDGVYLLDRQPNEDQSGVALNVVLTKLAGLKLYFGKRLSRDAETGLWTVQTQTTNGADGIVVDSVRFLEEGTTP